MGGGLHLHCSGSLRWLSSSPSISSLVPWDRMGSWGGLRWVALGLGAYGVLWVIMWVCAERAHPHYVSSTELVLRSGPMTIMRIPLAHVVKVAKRGYGDPSR